MTPPKNKSFYIAHNRQKDGILTSFRVFSAHQILGMDHQIPTTKESGTGMPSSEHSPSRGSQSNFGASSNHATTTQSTSQKPTEKPPVTPAAAPTASRSQHERDTHLPHQNKPTAPSVPLASSEASTWNINMDDPFPDSAESDYHPDLSDGDNNGKIHETLGGASAASHNLADGIATRTRAQFPIDTVCPLSSTCAKNFPATQLL